MITYYVWVAVAIPGSERILWVEKFITESERNQDARTLP